ncbi:hypothetical protein SE17_41690, partial [Kouleothrix aurantiaca]
MRRTLLLAPLLVVLLLVVFFVPLRAERTATPAVPGAPGAHVTQVDSSHYPDVTLYVGVTDDGGQPVGGLSARDFAVTEDGQPVTIGAFAGGAGAVSAALVIDRSGSMAEADKIDGAQEAAQAFVDQMHSADRTTLIAFDE